MIRRQIPFILASMSLTLILAGCNISPEPTNNATAMNEVEADAALQDALNATEEESSEIRPQFLGTLIPPAPGETGGLPDDRAPLNETAARTPTSLEASGATVQLWGLALSQGRYRDAYLLWADGGRSSGMSEPQFAQAYHRYSEIHVLVGRPEAGGAQTARVPVQMYGRMRDDGRPFNLVGTMTLTRNPAGQKGQQGQAAWLIAESDLSPRGTVRILPPGGEAGAGLIPQSFRGNWSSSTATCGTAGDSMRLSVGADSLNIYESVGKVSAAQPLSPNRLRVTARYSGEGETWNDTAVLTLADGGETLTIGSVKRVRCAA